ncbi:MAG: GNAT family N-acetyltransferase [Bacteroidales bacterium]|nr:GNAT family N-acetyltransferase [Bacteroidales bacterium]
MRVKLYMLACKLETAQFLRNVLDKSKKHVPDELIKPVEPDLLRKDIEGIPEEYKLFDYKGYSVFCVPLDFIPSIIIEIGRLREETFRAVGEGTNRSFDLDSFDLYYEQLFIWDNNYNQIVGAYRVGKGKDIIEHYGIKGFYVSSLFKIDKALSPMFANSIELGRSFVALTYQKQYFPLFLLWRGIMSLLLKNEDYRYLTGPVSISNNFSKLSKSMIVEFIKSKYFDKNIAQFVKPRKAFKISKDIIPDINTLMNTDKLDINLLDKMIIEIESNQKMPVLLKKYLTLNAKIVGFNIDPDFNDCLDGLILLDIFTIPLDALLALSKELQDEKIMERFTNKN